MSADNGVSAGTGASFIVMVLVACVLYGIGAGIEAAEQFLDKFPSWMLTTGAWALAIGGFVLTVRLLWKDR